MNLQDIKLTIINSLNQLLASKGQDPVSVDENIHLFGEGSIIDSLDLVSIIVELEEMIREQYGKSIEIVDENSVISDNSPFRTVETLANLAKEKFDEK